MSTTVEQILEKVEQLPPRMQAEALDFIHFLSNKLTKIPASAIEQESNGTKVVRVMAEIAERGNAFQEVTDPVAWQKDIRKDRSLQGRESDVAG